MMRCWWSWWSLNRHHIC